MNKKIDKKRILLALIFVIVFLSVILLSCRTNVGFVNDRIYYKMSYSNLKFLWEKKLMPMPLGMIIYNI